VGVTSDGLDVSALVGAWGSWGPSMTPDATRVAFVSDRSGSPEVWIQDVADAATATRIRFDDPVVEVSWSADSAWLAVKLATGGGVRTQVWVVRPDGTDARRIAGDEKVHASLGPWTRSGHRVVVTIPPLEPGRESEAYLADPATGQLYPLAHGALISVLDLSAEERYAVLRDGRRGEEFCVVVDRVRDHHLALVPGSGSTERAFVRPSPDSWEVPTVAYVATDVGRERAALVAVPITADGVPGHPQVLAERDDAELEALDGDDAGRLLLLVWNVAGRSEIELFDTATERRMPVPGVPGAVAYTPVLSRDGATVVLALESATEPRALWSLDTATHLWSRVTPRSPLHGHFVEPTLETFSSADGLEISGWLYRVPGRTEPGAAMLHLHGGPEAQERPTFSAQHQAMVRAGIAVFAPNVRGSSGFGRTFVHLDDREGRYGAFDDVVAAREMLVASGIADPARVAVTGRSYGGYLTLAALAFSPGVFAAGVDICGMSDLQNFYRETEPWIGAAAVTKYGHPTRDRRLLRAISPLRHASAIDAPLLVLHGELDSNVPIGEAHRIVAALRKLGRPVDYLELAGEGHEYRREDSKRLLIERMVAFLSETLGA
jgi:dipeptidyl aminopeptidase/acylaminoacyl peptidase